MKTLVVGLLIALAGGPSVGQTPQPATRKALVERLSRSLPVKELVGFPDMGPLGRSALVAANPDREGDIERLIQRQQACREPLAGPDVMHGLAVAALDASLTDAQLADIVAVVESSDFALMTEMMRSEPLGADIPPTMLEVAKRVVAQPAFRLLARTIGPAVARHFEKPGIKAGLVACDDRLKADLVGAGLRTGEDN